MEVGGNDNLPTFPKDLRSSQIRLSSHGMAPINGSLRRSFRPRLASGLPLAAIFAAGCFVNGWLYPERLEVMAAVLGERP